MLPNSFVNVMRTSGPFPPMLIRPTDDSGFVAVLALKMRWIASACAPNRSGLPMVSSCAVIG